MAHAGDADVQGVATLTSHHIHTTFVHMRPEVQPCQARPHRAGWHQEGWLIDISDLTKRTLYLTGLPHCTSCGYATYATQGQDAFALSRGSSSVVQN